MSLRRTAVFVISMLCLTACNSNSLSSPARIVRVESLSDGITVESVPPSHVVVVNSPADGLMVPGWGVVWDRKVGDGWEPAFEAPYSIDAAVTPDPAADYLEGAFHELVGQVAQTIWLSVPRESGVYRAEVGNGRYIVVRIGD